VRRKRLLLLGLAALGVLGGFWAYTQGQKPLDPFEEAMRQRQMYLETFGVLPGELFVEEGKELFFRKGPSGKTLEACDFGKGPGVLEGVYAILPKHPVELAMYNLGRELWYQRAGARDMSCAVCHDQYAGRRVRLSPVRSPKEGLGNEWPAYRFEADKLYTMEDRIAFCYESIAIPAPEFYSEPYIALTLYMLAEATKAGHSFEELPFFTR